MTTTSGVETETSPKISLRGVEGDIDETTVSRLIPTPRDTPLPELKKRFERDGYLFLKNLIPREDVLKVRRNYFQHFEDLGMLKPGTLPEDGIYNMNDLPEEHPGLGSGSLAPNLDEQRKLIESHVAPEYLQFLEHPALRGMVRDLMGWEKDTLLQRTMLRHNTLGGSSTGVHYDKLFLRGGDAYFLTAWVPIGDISINGGGLIYLSDSTSLGRSIEADFAERSKEFHESERVSAFNSLMKADGQLSYNAGEFHRDQAGGKGKWLASEFEAGDVVFHDPYLIHGSSLNETEKIRLSTDLRFYRDGSDIDARWMKYWVPNDGL